MTYVPFYLLALRPLLWTVQHNYFPHTRLIWATLVTVPLWLVPASYYCQAVVDYENTGAL